MITPVVRWVVSVGGVVVALAAPIGTDAAEPLSPEAQELIAHLDAKDLYERQRAFVRLEALREPASAAILSAHLNSRNWRTRALSARALAAVDGAKATAALLERLTQDRHPEVRVAALLGLEPLQPQDPSIQPALVAALRDRNAQVRIAAVDAVSRIDQPAARQALRGRWKRERHRDVRRVLEIVMKRLGELP